MDLRRQRGFSFLWTLMLVATMGAGLVVAEASYTTAMRREQERELLFVGRQFRDAIGRYHEATPGGAKQYPPSLEALLRDPRFPGLRRHLRRIYSDPVTGKAEWGLVRVDGRIAGVHSLSERAPIKVAGFEPDEAQFAGGKRYADWVFTYPPVLLAKGPAGSNPPGVPAAAPEGAPTAVTGIEVVPVAPAVPAKPPLEDSHEPR